MSVNRSKDLPQLNSIRHINNGSIYVWSHIISNGPTITCNNPQAS
ncbi:hypothetical protein MGN01_46440 [Methylobacterium gnaphalii]|uniref:Uncharacterized protein n=1 Tax=Methylobacterium gnaphalii TaxID=1010610 RepID=A0A512JS78_9HYPH|nr:hypothetical protein MGN01_46440 [Methylobacterium gnaphalii]